MPDAIVAVFIAVFGSIIVGSLISLTHQRKRDRR